VPARESVGTGKAEDSDSAIGRISESIERYKQLTAPYVLKRRPYWLYSAIKDGSTSPSHAAMDGKVFPAYSKIWDRWFPPNGYGCRCSVVSLGEEELHEMGLKISEELPTVEYVSPQTGAVIAQVAKPDEGWDFNPAKDPERCATLLRQLRGDQPARKTLEASVPAPAPAEPVPAAKAQKPLPEAPAAQPVAQPPLEAAAGADADEDLLEDEPWPEESDAPRPWSAGSMGAPRPAYREPAPSGRRGSFGLNGLRQALTRRSPAGVAVLAVVAVLVMGLFAHHLGYIGGEKVDPQGSRRITFTGISGYFLKNDQAGILYVVQGLARNGYKDKRGRIRIKAAIYDSTGKQMTEQTIYAGNVFTREELQRIALSDVSTKLAAPAEDRGSAMVRPGATVPFMAVFGNLPRSMGEFKLEAAGSSASSSS
jgi:hypothetical protein